MTIPAHVRTVDIMIVRSLTSVGGVQGVEIINGVIVDLMESVNPEVNNYLISVHTFTSTIEFG